MTEENLSQLLTRIRQCQLCQSELPLPARPILQCSDQSKILIAGQAPGSITHEKGIPFDDASGNRLREWLGVDREAFYNAEKFAIIPMGFCYPGKGKSGDLPPIPRCAATWRQHLLDKLANIELTIIVGKYAIAWHLNSKQSVTAEAMRWQELLQNNQLVLPHPSPRNNLWLQRHPWFEQEVIPALKTKVYNILNK